MGTGGLTYSCRCYAPSPSGVKEGEKSAEQSDVEVIILKKKGKEPLNEYNIKHSDEIIKLMNFLSSLSIASTTLLSSYINYQPRFPCYH